MTFATTGLDTAAPLDREPIDVPRFKEVLARLASGVAVVACWDGGEPAGLLVSSLTGLSVEPPRFLFCVRKQASAYPALARAGLASLTLLAADQQEQARLFSATAFADQRFRGPDWLFEADAPRLTGGLASIVGRLEPAFDAGEHTVFIFAAERMEDRKAEPLIYHDRGFARPVALV